MSQNKMNDLELIKIIIKYYKDSNKLENPCEKKIQII